ncbi:MAG: hypothetical protein ACLT9P_07610 [Evtepia gabavorous]
MGRPRKGAYRYFALRDLDGPDDYASMEQVHHPALPPMSWTGTRTLPAARTCCSSTGERPMRRWPFGH